MPADKSWWVYIIQTEKDQLYTGITTDIERRWKEHCAVSNGVANAKGAKYFRTQKPKKIVYQQCFASRSDASKREMVLKAMSRIEKELVVSAETKHQYEVNNNQ
jgi:putative endonuclease